MYWGFLLQFVTFTHNLKTTASYCCKSANLLNGSTAMQLQMKEVMVCI